jgi:hypothetical protein
MVAGGGFAAVVVGSLGRSEGADWRRMHALVWRRCEARDKQAKQADVMGSQRAE